MKDIGVIHMQTMFCQYLATANICFLTVIILNKYSDHTAYWNDKVLSRAYVLIVNVLLIIFKFVIEYHVDTGYLSSTWQHYDFWLQIKFLMHDDQSLQ